jgi:hypothetical protein
MTIGTNIFAEKSILFLKSRACFIAKRRRTNCVRALLSSRKATKADFEFCHAGASGKQFNTLAYIAS